MSLLAYHPLFLIAASFFGGLLLRRDPSTITEATPTVASRREEERKRSSFIYHFLVKAYDEWCGGGLSAKRRRAVQRPCIPGTPWGQPAAPQRPCDAHPPNVCYMRPPSSAIADNWHSSETDSNWKCSICAKRSFRNVIWTDFTPVCHKTRKITMWLASWQGWPWGLFSAGSLMCESRWWTVQSLLWNVWSLVQESKQFLLSQCSPFMYCDNFNDALLNRWQISSIVLCHLHHHLCMRMQSFVWEF